MTLYKLDENFFVKLSKNIAFFYFSGSLELIQFLFLVIFDKGSKIFIYDNNIIC